MNTLQKRKRAAEAVHRRFADALRRIAREKAFEAITVCEIARESALSTRTFYNHFRSKYDLVLWSYAHADDVYLKDAESVAEPIAFGELLLRGLRRFSADKDLFKGAFTDWVGPESLCMTLVDHGTRAIATYIRIANGEDAAPPRIVRLVRFYVEGTVSELAQWMADANPASAEDFRDFLMDAVPAPLKGLLSGKTKQETSQGKNK
ncbi:MAG: TetR/AcrR family transcriptional regulator [Kiritimatiellae bacterium]|nr:TetR/AcrR family transcriptional regulator [Kiritimatiellia bacterium]